MVAITIKGEQKKFRQIWKLISEEYPTEYFLELSDRVILQIPDDHIEDFKED